MTEARHALVACALPAREARSLLAHVLGKMPEELIAHPETPLDAGAQAGFARLAAERARGVPMAYLLGVQEFYGNRVHVGPQVLIPRPETELLVDTALRLLRQFPGAHVLELGTGSGCIALALARARPDLWIVATDRSVEALQLARMNTAGADPHVHLVAGDWYAPICGRFDLIVSNPPYVAASDPHLGQLGFEPRLALTDGGDGLSALECVIAGAAPRLAPGGHVLVEHGFDQAAACRALMQSQGLEAVRTLDDLEGRERACLGRRGWA